MMARAWTLATGYVAALYEWPLARASAWAWQESGGGMEIEIEMGQVGRAREG